MKILFVSDVKGWAFDITYQGIKKYIDCDLKYTSDNPKFQNSNITEYDRVHFFNWLGGQAQAGILNVSAGICQHNWEIKWADIAPKYIGRFKKVVAISREIEEKIIKINPNTTYIPNAVDPDLFKPVKNEGEFTVGWVSQKTSGGFGEEKTREGRKRWDIKGYQLLLKPLMHRMKGKVKFKICANDYTNAIPHEQMPQWYADIDVLLCTSLYEGGPFSVLEAAACGKPVISTNVGIVPELIKHGRNGFLCGKALSHKDIPDVLNKMEKYILDLENNPEIIDIMGRHNRIEIEQKWTWQKIVLLWKQFFEGD